MGIKWEMLTVSTVLFICNVRGPPFQHYRLKGVQDTYSSKVPSPWVMEGAWYHRDQPRKESRRRNWNETKEKGKRNESTTQETKERGERSEREREAKRKHDTRNERERRAKRKYLVPES